MPQKNPPQAMCEAAIAGDRWTCSVCGTSGRYVGLPIRRHCEADEQPIENPVEPCPLAGVEAGRVECPTCSGKVEIKTFVCLSPDVPQSFAAWTRKSLPPDVANCRTCEAHPRRAAVSTETSRS